MYKLLFSKSKRALLNKEQISRLYCTIHLRCILTMLSFYLKTLLIFLCLHVLCACDHESSHSANSVQLPTPYTAPASKDQDIQTEQDPALLAKLAALQTSLHAAKQQLDAKEQHIMQLQNELHGVPNTDQDNWEQALLELEVSHLRGNNREQQTERQRELAKYQRQEEELGHLRRQVQGLEASQSEKDTRISGLEGDVIRLKNTFSNELKINEQLNAMIYCKKKLDLLT